MRIEFTVPGVPVAQPRAKATGRGPFIRMYTPGKKVGPYKDAVRLAFKAARGVWDASAVFSVQIEAVFPRTKDITWKTKPMPRVRHTACSRNDCDNIAKSALDALTKFAWHDDSQVARLIVDKWIAAGDEQPHTKIVIETL